MQVVTVAGLVDFASNQEGLTAYIEGLQKGFGLNQEAAPVQRMRILCLPTMVDLPLRSFEVDRDARLLSAVLPTKHIFTRADKRIILLLLCQRLFQAPLAKLLSVHESFVVFATRQPQRAHHQVTNAVHVYYGDHVPLDHQDLRSLGFEHQGKWIFESTFDLYHDEEPTPIGCSSLYSRAAQPSIWKPRYSTRLRFEVSSSYFRQAFPAKSHAASGSVTLEGYLGTDLVGWIQYRRLDTDVLITGLEVFEHFRWKGYGSALILKVLHEHRGRTVWVESYWDNIAARKTYCATGVAPTLIGTETLTRPWCVLRH